MLSGQPVRDEAAVGRFPDRADDVLRQRNLFDEHVMPHANTFASALKELNVVAAKPSRPGWEIDQPCLRRMPLPVWLTSQVSIWPGVPRQVYRCCCWDLQPLRTGSGCDAAGLIERSLAPHILNQSTRSGKHVSLTTRLRDERSGWAIPNRLSTQLNDFLRH